MSTTTTVSSPVEAVRLADPYPYYARLVAERPFAWDEGLGVWVAADAAAVRAVLGSGALRVRPVAEPVPAGIAGTAAGEVFGELVRMTDGARAARLKQVVAGALARADTAYAASLARGLTREVLAAGGEVPYEELMFGVPARVVAALCGLTEGAGREAARAIGDFVQCIPAGATEEQYAAASAAATRLRALLAPALTQAQATPLGTPAPAAPGTASGSGGVSASGGNAAACSARPGQLLGELVAAAERDGWARTGPLLSNAVGFLSQTYDATAGLIGNTLVALARGAGTGTGSGDVGAGGTGALVREVVRYDAPIQNTRRFAAEPFTYAGSTVEPGQQVLVLLAAANRDPAVNPDPHALSPGRVNPAVFTFGAAAHRCPGAELATALAGAVVAELRAAGLGTTATPAYRPLANARIPLL
ncbi:cytochrome P450 [Streptomyces sp. WAC07149]|uniref:cytochrome P450 n=1 Tax=Streptomyces sp. WAC07149 TaxID=2487425 RepID=UPI000F79B3A7|nr:cytochrome P450 [Streptomyces sp. WAC07149]RST05461.1 cytochrome P450 [Streptomyces sp. WAC07149]